MKSISMYQRNKNMLKDITNENTFDKAINTLIDNVENYMPLVTGDSGKRSPVKINEDTIERIKVFALSEGESVENILVRMMIIANQLD